MTSLKLPVLKCLAQKINHLANAFESAGLVLSQAVALCISVLIEIKTSPAWSCVFL